jgi:hypothetical protein
MNLHPHMNRLDGCFVEHQANPFEPKYIGDFMGINKHGGRTVWNDRSHKFRYSEHTGFDVHMTVQQPRNQVSSSSLDYLCIWTHCVGCIWTDVGDSLA